MINQQTKTNEENEWHLLSVAVGCSVFVVYQHSDIQCRHNNVYLYSYEEAEEDEEHEWWKESSEWYQWKHNDYKNMSDEQNNSCPFYDYQHNGLVDQHNGLVDQHNDLVDQHNGLVDQHNVLKDSHVWFSWSTHMVVFET